MENNSKLAQIIKVLLNTPSSGGQLKFACTKINTEHIEQVKTQLIVAYFGMHCQGLIILEKESCFLNRQSVNGGCKHIT